MAAMLNAGWPKDAGAFIATKKLRNTPHLSTNNVCISPQGFSGRMYDRLKPEGTHRELQQTNGKL